MTDEQKPDYHEVLNSGENMSLRQGSADVNAEGVNGRLHPLVRPQCAATIQPRGEGYYMVSAGRAWPRRRKCERPACENGYCWQHQRLATEMELAYQRNPALRANASLSRSDAVGLKR